MAGATNLSISWEESLETQKGYQLSETWTSEPVVELLSMSRFEVRCKIKTLMLSRTTIYGTYMVYSLGSRSLHPAKAMIIFDNYEPDADAGAKVVKIEWTDNHDELTTQRKCGWLEVHLGSFYLGNGDFEVVEARLSANEGWNDILGVSGIEFRALEPVKEA